MKTARIYLIISLCIFISALSSYSSLSLDKDEVSFLTLQDLEAGFDIEASNGSCCGVNIEWLEFRNPNSLFGVEGLDPMPYSVQGNRSVVFKIVFKGKINAEYPTELKEDVLTLQTSAGDLPITISYKEGLVAIKKDQRGQNPKHLTLHHSPTAIFLTLHKTGIVNAKLFSMQGKRISTLLQNKQMTHDRPYSISKDLSMLSKGLYLLTFSINYGESKALVQRKIILGQ